MATETLTKNSIAGLTIAPVKERSQYINILLYGDSGVGKTRLAGSADAVPSLRKVLFVDIEGGTTTLVNSYPNCEVVRVKNWKEMQQVYDALYNKDVDYNTVVLDSLTEIQKFNMSDIMMSVVQKRPDLDPDVPSMREWGKNLEQIRRFVRGFRDLEINTIFTALARSERDERTGITYTKPSLSGKMADEVAAFLDIVGYLYVKEVSTDGGTKMQRLLLTQKTDNVIAKDRSGKLEQVIPDPDMSAIYKLLK